MSREFKAIETKKFIIERMSHRHDIDSKINTQETINNVMNYDESFIVEMDIHKQDYCNEDEINFIIENTGYKYEFIELVLWQKYIYEMNQGVWGYDVEPCINCGSNDLKFREVEEIDFVDKIICEECGCEMTIGEDGLEAFGSDRDWVEYLTGKLTFPFEAEVCEYQEVNYISQGDKLRVHGIDGDDDLYGIIVSVRKGRKKYSVPLVDLEPINLKPQGKMAVAEYMEWFCNR